MILHLIKKSEAFDFVWGLIKFAYPSLKNGELMDLAVVPASLLLKIIALKALSLKIVSNAIGIGAMRLGNAVLNAGVLGKIAVGVGDFKLWVVFH